MEAALRERPAGRGGKGSPGPRISIYKGRGAGRSLMPRNSRERMAGALARGSRWKPVCTGAGLQVYHKALDVIWEGTLSDLPSQQGLRPVLHQQEATWPRARLVSQVSTS